MKKPAIPQLLRRQSRTRTGAPVNADGTGNPPSPAPPERQEVLALLRERGVPLTADELASALEVPSNTLLAFHNRLLAMERDGQLLRNRKGALCIVDKLDLIVGRVEGHPDGHGFLARDDKGPDLYLNANEMRKVLNGDRV